MQAHTRPQRLSKMSRVQSPPKPPAESLYDKTLITLTIDNKHIMLLDDWQFQLTY